MRLGYTRWTSEVKQQAKKARLAGSTYSQIGKLLGVPKSTLNIWFKNMPNTKHLYYVDRLEWLRQIRKLSAETKIKTRADKIQAITDKVKLEVDNWSLLHSKESQRVILSMIYWAEGQKLPLKTAPVRFANTDPRLVLLFLKLLRSCYEIDENKLRVRLYLHWYHDEKRMKKFWQSLLNIDDTRFSKTHLKKRSKTRRFRRNFAGICFVTYHSVDLRWEIVQTGYKIAEAILGPTPAFIA